MTSAEVVESTFLIGEDEYPLIVKQIRMSIGQSEFFLDEDEADALWVALGAALFDLESNNKKDGE